ncbi:MAG: 4-hydroxythreonine-4-phosphate dehydrogenase PdxA [Chloroherpetonaceae bacterium]|nr:4-hydroxythreonine-4-phosphate dehydrogenase PdxA [Chloroherpetonaceae bacterium]
MKPILVSMGDPNGIGPEIILKAHLCRMTIPTVVVGHFHSFLFHQQHLAHRNPVFEIPLVKISLDDLKNFNRLIEKEQSKDFIYLYDPFDDSDSFEVKFGEISGKAGKLALTSIEAAANLCKSEIGSAMVTAPIHKESLKLSGSLFKGHTDFLGHVFQATSEMILCDRRSGLKIALATVHTPLSDVANRLKIGAFKRSLRALIHFLKTDYIISQPKIAILGLNPHASDNGVIGNDETSYLKTDLEEMRNEFPSCKLEGFFPADGFFGSAQYKNYDCILALYHDSGLIPFKMLAFETGVNVTMGLPIVRTSPDHGTAFDIAGKGIASSKSFEEAILLAHELYQNRVETLKKNWS